VVGVRRLVSFLYRLARLLRDVEVLSSGDPRRIARRVRNKVLGRWMGRVFRL
jgi:hypothetical protein